MSLENISGSRHPVPTTTTVHHDGSSLLHTNLKSEIFAKNDLKLATETLC